MLRILVTGAAGFIGSHLCERFLLDEQNEVIGVGWTDARNLSILRQQNHFQFIEEDLLHIKWNELLPEVDVIYHLAGMPGVRSSWGNDFYSYVTNNILVTQRLLEACKEHPIQKLVYISTSSVYGEKEGKISEDTSTEPLSPYGVTKLAGEKLCHVYAHTDHLPIVVLRYFTVYGPRQRTDMAFHRIVKNLLNGDPIPIYGDGKQTRDFTYVSDCVEATAAVLHAPNVIGETINIGGKERASILEAISILEELYGQKAKLMYLGEPRGEPRNTWADISKARKLLKYKPKVDLKAGLKAELQDLYQLYKGSSS